MEITTIALNLYHFFIILSVFCGVALIAFLIHSGFNINLFVKKDENIACKFLDRFPLVLPEFTQKSLKEQNIENNQEIHEINKQIEELKKQISEIKGE